MPLGLVDELLAVSGGVPGRGRSGGLYAAPFTPFAAGGEIQFDLIPRLVDLLLEDGVRGAFVCGSNGEGPSLSTAERKKLAEAWISASAGRLQIMVHVGHASIAEARDLAAHAASAGADSMSAVASFYFRVSDVSRLVECMAEIASGAPSLPFYYYHIPAITSVNIDMVSFLELAEGRIGNLAGIKYTAPTLWEYQACLAAAGGAFDVLYGLDEMLLPALAVGARAAIGSTYNFAAPLYHEVIRAHSCNRHEDARTMMERLIEMVRVLHRFPAIPAQKEIMRLRGLDLGMCRLPLSQLSVGDAESLDRQLHEVGFWAALKQARENRHV